MSKVALLQGDAIEVLRTLPDKSVHVCICSPPFYGLRDYQTASWEGGDPGCKHTVSKPDKDNKATDDLTGRVYRGKRDSCLKCGATRIDQQIGLEETPEDYILRLVEVFREVHRVLRDDGTLWLNLGESFWGGKGKSGYELPHEAAARHARGDTMQKAHNVPGSREMRPTDGKHGLYKPKDLMLMPARVALALLADGWFLRQDVIWFAPNKKPESVKDRPTLSHEHVFLFAKRRHYYYDNEAVKVEGAGALPWGNKRNFKYNDPKGQGRHGKGSMFSGGTQQEYIDKWYSGKVQRRSVWSIPTKPFKGAHFAPFPEALVEPCLLASTSEKGCCPTCGSPWKRMVEKDNPTHDMSSTKSACEKGTSSNRMSLLRQAARANGEEYVDRTTTVGWEPSCQCPGDLEPIACTAIDIFMGSGTVGVVCVKHHRDFIGIDLNPDYLTLAQERIAKVQPLLLELL